MDDTIYVGNSQSLGHRILRRLGVRTVERERRGHLVRASWFEASTKRGHLGCFETGISLIDFGDDRDDPDDHRYSINLKVPGLSLFLFLPAWFWRSRKSSNDDFMHGSVGVHFQSIDTEFPSELVVSRFSGTVARIQMPWALSFHRGSKLLTDGSWHHDYDRDRLGAHRARLARKNRWRALVGLPALPDPRAGETWQVAYDRERALPLATESHPYRYVLQSGEVQERTATVTVNEREWRRLWLFWTPYLALVRRTIEIKFSGEVGERSGSWKGGCTGCSYEIMGGETPAQTLHRMELTRKF